MLKEAKDQAVVGEDGELLQPDITVDESAYTEFVETYVHRDPLWFRIRENIREHRLSYLFFTLLNLCMAGTLINDLFSNMGRVGGDLLGIIGINLGIGLVAGIVYVILEAVDTRQ